MASDDIELLAVCNCVAYAQVVSHRVRCAAGREYLALVTELLQRARLDDAGGGIWEPADLQWWWRHDQHSDRANAVFWIDPAGRPVGAVVFTDWGEIWGCDVLVAGAGTDGLREELWGHARDRMSDLIPKPVEVSVRDDDEATIALLRDEGFSPAGVTAVACWMSAERRPSVASLAVGYRRRAGTDEPHHMVARSGPEVAERLRECSLYDHALDICIESIEGDVAAYGLFWADRQTGVGLVEPMRTEDSHQRWGLGRHVLTAGLTLLASRGCTSFKVTYMEGNEASCKLYLGAGFEPRSTSRAYRKAAISV